MNADLDAPRLNFFRATPPSLVDMPPLASSLQSFETVLFLIGLDRYPAALMACATAWESALKAKLRIGPEEDIKLWRMQKQVRAESPSLQAVTDDEERLFRDTRNRIVHYGYSPRDDEECAMLLLKTGLPYLSLLYSQLFDFYLDWQDIPPRRSEFSALTFSPVEAAKVGLVPYVMDHIRNALAAYESVEDFDTVRKVYCFAGLSHYIRIALKEGTMSDRELAAVNDPNNMWEAENHLKQKLESVLHPAWRFDCPICNEGNALVAELDDDKLDASIVTTLRCECVRCGFFLGKDAAFLSTILLRTQIPSRAAEILKECGIAPSKPESSGR